MPYISEKDYGDIVFAVENDYDFIAASFVRCADDVLAIRKILEEKGGEDIHIIAIQLQTMNTLSRSILVAPTWLLYLFTSFLLHTL